VNSLADIIQTIAVYAIPVLFAITVHEAAHGWMANRLGDNTAAMLGRVTLNPVKHIDPVGTILIPLMLYFATSGAFVFGYAKPVPVRFGRLSHPRWGTLWVALAGPLANLAQALAWGVLLILLQGVGVTEQFFLKMCMVGVGVNVVMCVFNLFPVPPLDGGRVLVSLLPARPAIALSRLEPWGFFIVMALLVTHVIDWLWMRPLMTFVRLVLGILLYPLRALLL